MFHLNTVVKFLVVYGLLASFSGASIASDDQRFIGVECHQTELRISYHRDRLNPLFKEGYLVDTFQLKTNDPSGEYVKSTRKVEQRCRIGKTEYVVQVTAVPGALRLNAECGGETFGAVKVFTNGRSIFETQFEGCSGDQVVIGVTFGRDARTPPVIASLPKADFR